MIRPQLRPALARSASATILAVAMIAVLVPVEGIAETMAGYRVVKKTNIAPGLKLIRLKGGNPPQDIWVAKRSPSAPFDLAVAVSNNRLSGNPLFEQTSSMCRRLNCLVATNADFYLRDGWPKGAAIVKSQPVTSRRMNYPNVMVMADGSLKVDRPNLTSKMRARYPQPDDDGDPATPPPPDVVVAHLVSGLNVPRAKDQIVLYTPWQGSRTKTTGGFELKMDIVGGERVRLDRTARLTVKAVDADGNARIPSSGVVLSGQGAGASALKQLHADILSGAARPTLTLRFRANPAIRHASSGHPPLIDDGVIVVTGDSRFNTTRNPRTAIGWTAKGHLLMVTVDGRRTDALGMTIPQLAKLMKRLGAVHALNMDGGGSTTFVVKDRVRNKPSDGSERSVATSLLLVKR